MVINSSSRRSELWPGPLAHGPHSGPGQHSWPRASGRWPITTAVGIARSAVSAITAVVPIKANEASWASEVYSFISWYGIKAIEDSCHAIFNRPNRAVLRASRRTVRNLCYGTTCRYVRENISTKQSCYCTNTYVIRAVGIVPTIAIDIDRTKWTRSNEVNRLNEVYVALFLNRTKLTHDVTFLFFKWDQL